MGSCISAISSGRKIDKNEETGRLKEIEETPVVEIYIRCPSGTKSRQSHQEVRQATKNTTKVSSSIELKDIEFVNTSSILSVSEWEAGELRTRGHHHGLEQRCNIQEQPAENNYKSLNINTYKESLLEQGNSGNEESSSWTERLSESSRFSSSTTLPPPRPSLWKALYFNIIKPKEKSFDKNLMRTSRRSLKKKHVKQVKTTYPLKKIQKPVRTNRGARYLPQSNEVLPVNEDEIKIYDLECVREDGNESSASNNPASARSSAAASCDKSISISLGENPESRALGIIGTVMKGSKLHQNWWIQGKRTQ